MRVCIELTELSGAGDTVRAESHRDLRKVYRSRTEPHQKTSVGYAPVKFNPFVLGYGPSPNTPSSYELISRAPIMRESAAMTYTADMLRPKYWHSGCERAHASHLGSGVMRSTPPGGGGHANRASGILSTFSASSARAVSSASAASSQASSGLSAMAGAILRFNTRRGRGTRGWGRTTFVTTACRDGCGVQSGNLFAPRRCTGGGLEAAATNRVGGTREDAVSSRKNRTTRARSAGGLATTLCNDAISSKAVSYALCSLRAHPRSVPHRHSVYVPCESERSEKNLVLSPRKNEKKRAK